MKTKQATFSLILASLFLFLLSSCGNDSVKLVQAMESGYEYQGKKIELVGEFDAPYFMFQSGRSKTIPMSFVVKAHAMSSDKHSVSGVILNLGTSANSALLDMAADQKKYTLKNFYVFDKNGEKYNLDEHPEFKITGTVNYAEFKKPEGERNKTNFSYEITDVVIDEN